MIRREAVVNWMMHRARANRHVNSDCFEGKEACLHWYRLQNAWTSHLRLGTCSVLPLSKVERSLEEA
ncbi:hypothetical protein vseg_008934 [Gypsophila vaccaria]